MRPMPWVARCWAIASALCLLAPAASAQGEAAKPPETDEQKTLYFLGVVIGKNVQGQYQLTPEESEWIARGVVDSVSNRETPLDESVYGARLGELQKTRQAEAGRREKAASVGYLDEMAAEPGAERSESGVVYVEIEAGTGPSPDASDTVEVHYHGRLRDGRVFDSSVQRGQPARFPLTGVIRCWTEAVQKMKVGGKAKITCPSETAYGERGMPPTIPGGAALTFDVELISIGS